MKKEIKDYMLLNEINIEKKSEIWVCYWKMIKKGIFIGFVLVYEIIATLKPGWVSSQSLLY